jgi:hypothetical membrane protein
MAEKKPRKLWIFGGIITIIGLILVIFSLAWPVKSVEFVRILDLGFVLLIIGSIFWLSPEIFTRKFWRGE